MRTPDAFRSPNDELAGASLEALEHVEPLDFVCECGRVNCRKIVQLTLPTFTWARRRGLHVVSPRHLAGTDVPVETTATFVLVRRNER
jgi:hypothetical protein